MAAISSPAIDPSIAASSTILPVGSQPSTVERCRALLKEQATALQDKSEYLNELEGLLEKYQTKLDEATARNTANEQRLVVAAESNRDLQINLRIAHIAHDRGMDESGRLREENARLTKNLLSTQRRLDVVCLARDALTLANNRFMDESTRLLKRYATAKQKNRALLAAGRQLLDTAATNRYMDRTWGLVFAHTNETVADLIVKYL